METATRGRGSCGQEESAEVPAQPRTESLQGVRRGEHLRAQSAKEPVQGVRRGRHLPAQSHTEQVQDVHSRQGRVDAAGSRGALNALYFINTDCLSKQKGLFGLHRDADLKSARGDIHAGSDCAVAATKAQTSKQGPARTARREGITGQRASSAGNSVQRDGTRAKFTAK